jgi:hypothetical protein
MPRSGLADERFEERHFQYRGDVEYLNLLDLAGRMFAPDPELQKPVDVLDWFSNRYSLARIMKGGYFLRK